MTASARIIYEPLSEAHAVDLYPVLSPPEVWRYISPSEATSVEALAARYRRVADGPRPGDPGQTWVNYAMRLRDGDRPHVGRIEATVYDGWAEVAYLLGPAYWGRGLATEAMRWFRDHLRDEHQVHELWAATVPANTASCRLLERLGFAQAEPTRKLASADPGDLLYRWGNS